METENQTAKVIIISSCLTLVVVFSVGFILRDSVVSYIQSRLVMNPATNIPETNLTTNQQIISAIEKVNPAVVSVVVTKDVPVYERYYENVNPGGFWGSFSVPRVRENGTEEREVGGGSGFIVSNDGLIVTNKHVVEDETARYSIFLNDGTSYKVKVLARDTDLDVAILKIDEPLKEALTFVNFGDSDKLKLGEAVIVIGNALAEFRNSVSVGVISGLSRSIVASNAMGNSEQLDHVIQTDAAINPGNSGGPLLNIKGEVIGVSVATSRGADNISFALPAQVVKLVVDSVRENGEIVRPFLGVRYTMINEKIATENNLPFNYGALINLGKTAEEPAIVKDSPAYNAGLTIGTIILSIDGEELRDKDLASILRSKKVGQEIKLRIFQNGEEKTVTIKLSPMPKI